MKRKLLLTILLLGAALATAVYNLGSGAIARAVLPEAPTPEAQPLPYQKVASFTPSEAQELSGIVFHPRRKTLFAVGDQGQVLELQPDGAVIRQKKVRPGADFEGITCRPDTGMLYVVVEGVDSILEVNPEFLEVTREIPVDRTFNGKILIDPAGNGLEDIAFVPTAAGGVFYLVNQSDDLTSKDPSIILAVTVTEAAGKPIAKINSYFSVGLTDMSGLYYNPANRHLLVISDSNDRLLEIDLSGQVLAGYNLPGQHQEGITLDEAGFLYLAQDSKKHILKFSPTGQ